MTKEITIIQFYKKLIRENILEKGAMLPVESEICSMFNASRMTVRKAMDKMVEQGWIYRISGKGTFVSKIAIENAYGLEGLSKFFKRKGYGFESKVLKMERKEAEPYISKILHIPQGGEAYHLKRLRIADGKPISVESVFLNALLFPGLEQFDFASESLYRVLRDTYNREIRLSNQTIYTADVEGDIALRLFNQKTATAMRAVILGYDKNSQLIVYEESYYNGYEYSFNVIVRKE